MRRTICSNQSPICVITDAAAAAARWGKLDVMAAQHMCKQKKQSRSLFRIVVVVVVEEEEEEEEDAMSFVKRQVYF